MNEIKTINIESESTKFQTFLEYDIIQKIQHPLKKKQIFDLVENSLELLSSPDIKEREKVAWILLSMYESIDPEINEFPKKINLPEFFYLNLKDCIENGKEEDLRFWTNHLPKLLCFDSLSYNIEMFEILMKILNLSLDDIIIKSEFIVIDVNVLESLRYFINNANIFHFLPNFDEAFFSFLYSLFNNENDIDQQIILLLSDFSNQFISQSKRSEINLEENPPE